MRAIMAGRGVAARVCARQGIRHLHHEPEPQTATNCGCKYQACLAQSARPPDLRHHRACGGVLSDARGRRRCLKHALPTTPLIKATSTSQEPAPCSLLRDAGALLRVHAALAPSRPRSMGRALMRVHNTPVNRRLGNVNSCGETQGSAEAPPAELKMPDDPRRTWSTKVLWCSKSPCQQLHAHA